MEVSVLDVMTLKEAAEYLRVSESTLLRLLKGGKIPAGKVGRQWRIRRVSLDAYLEGVNNGQDKADG